MTSLAHGLDLARIVARGDRAARPDEFVADRSLLPPHWHLLDAPKGGFATPEDEQAAIQAREPVLQALLDELAALRAERPDGLGTLRRSGRHGGSVPTSDDYRMCAVCGRDCMSDTSLSADGTGVRIAFLCPEHGVQSAVAPFADLRLCVIPTTRRPHLR